MRSFMLLIFVSFPAVAMNWFDMETRKDYSIIQNLSLPQRERSQSILEITKGEKFYLKEINGGAGLGIFNFEYKSCPGQELETEVEVIPVEGTPFEVGAMVASGCELWVFVELKDFWTPSIFE